MSSAVYAAPDGTLFVGQEAERQAAGGPSRYEPNPKRRIDEGDLLLGDNVLRVTDVVHAVLKRAVTEARRLAGDAEVELLVLTHPADWGATRTRLLRQAAGGLARQVALVPEPVAAAVYHAATFAPADLNSERTVEFSGRPGDALAVLDLGGGTVDVSVVQRMPGSPADRSLPAKRAGFQVLATRGDPSFGGADVDQALLEHVGSLVSSVDPPEWRKLVEGRELTDRRRRRVLRQDVRGAKETLSRHAYTDVPMPPPFADAHVTREDLERLIAGPLGRAVELTVGAIGDSGLRPKQLTAIFLVGGSSRIPMVSRLVHERTGVVPTTLDQPETVVARGALRAVLIDPDRTGSLAGSAVSRVGAPAPAPADRRPPFPPGPQQPASGPLPQSAFSPLNATRQQGPPSPPRGQQGMAPPPPPPWRPGEPSRDTKPAERGGKSKKTPWIIAAAAVAVAAVVGGVLYAVNSGEAEPDGRTLAQYDYRFIAPPDWTQTDDRVADRQVVIHPSDSLTGDDLVVAQEYVMNYDATVDRQKLVDELAGSAEREPTKKYSGFNGSANYAGRTVVYYRETKPKARVDWYVVAQGKFRVHIGCQYGTGSPLEPRVSAACEQVVKTMAVVN